MEPFIVKICPSNIQGTTEKIVILFSYNKLETFHMEFYRNYFSIGTGLGT